MLNRFAVSVGVVVSVVAFVDMALAIAQLAPYRVVIDAVPDPLEARVGDAARGRAIVLDRAIGNCLICHRVPVPGEPFQGDIGPDLTGVGARLTAAQIRLRLIDQSLLNATTIMPPYYRVEGLRRVGEPFVDRPVLDAQQIEDVVAWLATLKTETAE